MTQLQKDIEGQAKAQDRLAAQQITPEQRRQEFSQLIDTRLSGGLSSISDSFSEKFDGLQHQIRTGVGSGMPAGLGFDNLTSGAIPQINDSRVSANRTVPSGSTMDSANDMITIMPVTSIGFTDKKTRDKQRKLTIDGKLIDEEEDLKKSISLKNKKDRIYLFLPSRKTRP